MKKEDKLKLLRNFNEYRLIAEVITPLLEKMEFKDITSTHKKGENGLDLVCYEDDRFEERLYVGVQVKAIKIHGCVSKTGNATEIFNQAQQAFSYLFMDVNDNKEKRIDKYIVMTSGEITAEARESISGQLRVQGFLKPIQLFDGNKIVTLVDNKMPALFWEEYDYFNRYFQKMKEEFSSIADISAIGQKEAVSLEEIYVSLKLSESARERDIPGEYENDKIFDGKMDVEEKSKNPLPGRGRSERVMEPEKAVQQFQRLVILGAPGAGKTTLLKHLALKSCKENLLKQERTVIPIPITLREFFQVGKPLREYIDAVFEKYDFPDAKQFAEKELKTGTCILLLDGFDELAAKENQEKVTREIQAFAQRYQACKVVVTSRPAGYHDELAGYTRLEVMEFDDTQIEGFIKRWFGETGGNKAQAMLKAVMENENIKTLARNPLLVSIIAVIYEEDRELPQRRAELYKRAVEVLLSRWDKRKKLTNRYTSDQKEFILKKLAYNSHCCNRRVLKEAEILAEIARHSSRLGLRETDAQLILAEIWQRSFLLKQIAPETYDFLHLSFQEYFTAMELKDREGGTDIIMKHIVEPWWEEPVLLFAGISKDAGPLIRRIRQEVPEDIFYSNLVLSGKCIADAEFTDPELKNEIAQELWRLYQEGESPLIRGRVMTVISRMKPRFIIDSLVKELHDENSEIRQHAASKLGVIGSSEAVEPLLKALASEKNKKVYENVANALRSIGNKEAMKPLIKVHATDDRNKIRRRAAETLRKIENSKDIGLLLQTLASDKNEYLRRSAASALGKIGSSEAIKLLLRVLTSDKDSEVRGTAAFALGRIGSSEAVEPLLHLLASNKESEVRWYAVYALGKIGSSKAVEPLLKVLTSDKDQKIRGSAARALGAIGSSEAIKPLLQALASDEDDNVRGNAANALGKMESSEAIEPLLRSLDSDDSSYVRGCAAEALGNIGSSEAIEVLIQALASDKDSFVRANAAIALGTIGDNSVIQQLINTLDDEEEATLSQEQKYFVVKYSPQVKDVAYNALDKICRRVGKRIIRDASNAYKIVDVTER